MSKIPKFLFRGITRERFEITQKELLIFILKRTWVKSIDVKIRTEFFAMDSCNFGKKRIQPILLHRSMIDE